MKTRFGKTLRSKIPWREYLKARDYDEDINNMCRDCRAIQTERHGQTTVVCSGKASSDQLVPKELAPLMTDSEMQLAETMASPYSWAKRYVSPKKFKARWYQEQMTDCTAKRLVIRCGRRNGKALAIDTPIPTPDGWKTMKYIHTGDLVFGEQGEHVRVIGETEVMEDRECYEITFSNGHTMTADAEHQWTVAVSYGSILEEGPKRVLTTQEMEKSLNLKTVGNIGFCVEAAKEVEHRDIPIPCSPYILGTWLAAGKEGTDSVLIDKQDLEEIKHHIKECGVFIDLSPEVQMGYYKIYGLVTTLQRLGVSKVKRIPGRFLVSSTPNRKEVLRGIMDSIGEVEPSGRVKFVIGEDKLLAEDIAHLIAGLGMVCSPIEKRRLGTTFTYAAWFYPSFNVFKLKRKHGMIEEVPVREHWIKITSIAKTSSVPVKCIEVDSESRLYLASRGYIPTHNSFSLSLKMVHKAVMSQKKILIVTPYEVQAKELMDTMIELIRALDPDYETYDGLIKKFIKSPTYLLEFRNGSKIKAFTTGSSGSGSVRGQCLPGGTLIHMAEGGTKRIKDIRRGDRVQSIVDSRMRNSPVGKIFDTSTKKTVKVTLLSGRTMESSWDHRFNGSSLCPEDRAKRIADKSFKTEWKKVREWKPGEYISVSKNLSYKRTSRHSCMDILLYGFYLCCEENMSTGTELDSEMLTLPKKKQALLISSLLEGSGTITLDEKRGETCIQFQSISRKLAKQFMTLLASLGIISSLGTGGRQGRYPLHRVKLKQDRDVSTLLKAIDSPLLQQHIGHETKQDKGEHLHYKDIFFDEILKVEEFSSQKMYDIEVLETNNFIIDGGIVTHNSADIIVLDEVDYMSEADFASIIAILADNPDVELWVASTPNGKTQLHRLEQLPSYRGFHFPSYVIPHYNDELDEEFRRQFSDIPYVQEVMAEFGEADMSVFQDVFIDAARVQDTKRDKVLVDRESYIVIMGVDWNHDKNGTRIVAVAFDRSNGNIFTCGRERVSREGWTQVDAVNKIIEMNRKFVFDHIYLDEGFGQAQIEFIRQYGLSMIGQVPVGHPDLRLSAVQGINFASKIEVIPAAGGEMIKKDMKPYMVDNTARLLERGVIQFISPEDDNLMLELANYCIKSRSPTGRPVYGVVDKKIGDHDLDAFMIALLGLSMEYSSMLNFQADRLTVATISKDDMKATDGTKEPEKEMKALVDPDSYSLLFSKVGSRNKEKTSPSRAHPGYNRGTFKEEENLTGIIERFKRQNSMTGGPSSRAKW